MFHTSLFNWAIAWTKDNKELWYQRILAVKFWFKLLCCFGPGLQWHNSFIYCHTFKLITLFRKRSEYLFCFQEHFDVETLECGRIHFFTWKTESRVKIPTLKNNRKYSNKSVKDTLWFPWPPKLCGKI